MTKAEFLKQLIELLDSAPYNWDLWEDGWGEKISVDDVITQLTYYNQGLEI